MYAKQYLTVIAIFYLTYFYLTFDTSGEITVDIE